MECNICHNVNLKFFCANCLRQRLHTHNNEMKHLTLEKQRYVDRSAKVMNGPLRSHQSNLAEKHKLAQRLNHVEIETERLREEIGRGRQELDILKKNLQTRRQVLQESLTYFKKFQSHQKASITKDITTTKERWRQVHSVFIHSRKVLIGELVSLFDLKRIVKESEKNDQKIVTRESRKFSKENGTEESDILPIRNGIINDDDAEYSIAGRTLPKKGNFIAYPQEEINTAVGHVIHMLGLVAHYLGVKLPFFVTRDPRSNSYARGTFPGFYTRKRPLFLTDHNSQLFTVGMAMLNYNIAYLCHSQGVEIPFNKVPYTLRNLYHCCHSVNLGRYSHLTTLSASEQTFALDFEQLVRIMFARRNGDDSPRIFSASLYDNYFYDGEDDEENEDGNETWDLVEMVV
ncbi:hypothetical protein G9A89_018561 [Geosiphon pyriformis]|nr:hypothetical protein G9A89_018561 [Geosiphon pyriformis]